MSEDRSNPSRTRKRIAKARVKQVPQSPAARTDAAPFVIRKGKSFTSWKHELSLLRTFASNGHSSHPKLIDRVARGFGEWLATGCDPEKAQRAFGIARPNHREASSVIAKRHIRAVREYLIKCGEGATDALEAAAESVGLDIKTVAPLLRGLHKPNGVLTEAQEKAIISIEQEALLPGYAGPARDKDFLKRCLGDGWNKWQAYKRARKEFRSQLRRLARIA